MGDDSTIEWCDATLNVVTGCTKVSDGCLRCYIERTPPFRKAGRRFDHAGIGGATGVLLHPERLTLPLRWRRPRRIFVNSLSDLFHDDVPEGLIAALWLVMGQCAGCIPEQHRGHTFQVLTKRPARMRAFLRRWADTGDPAIPPMDKAASRCGRAELVAAAEEFIGPMTYDWMDGPRYWPTALPGVWLGVSVEDQHAADTRIPILVSCPAEARWLSVEPMLGPVDLSLWIWGDRCPDRQCRDSTWDHECRLGEQRLRWLVAGGESGPGARPVHPDWLRSLRDQCADAGVPYLVKQWGQYAPVSDRPAPGDLWLRLGGATIGWSPDDGYVRAGGGDFRLPGGGRTVLVRRARSKHDTGRLLDGVLHDAYPAVGVARG